MSVTESTRLLEWGRERLRAGPWRGDASVAYLNPVPGSPLPSPEFIRRCLRTLTAQGYARVVTGALSPSEQTSFRSAGFRPSEELHLLAHDLRALPPIPPRLRPDVALRRAGRGDRPAVLVVDARAFDAFWRLDCAGLEEAMSATPHSRFRVAAIGPADRERIVGYTITGRAGRRGYLQRLAVDPDVQRGGIGSLLVVDALRWLKRWRADRAMVNTQLQNGGALALYERLGFRRETVGLAVLAADLQP